MYVTKTRTVCTHTVQKRSARTSRKEAMKREPPSVGRDQDLTKVRILSALRGLRGISSTGRTVFVCLAGCSQYV